MKKLDDLISKLKAIEREFIDLIEIIIRENEHVIIDMNAEDQLFKKGIDRNGVSIMSYAPYAPFTIEIKRMKGQPTSRVTLRDEGEFHSSFYVEYQQDGFEIKALDWKTDELIKGYGEEIMGLTNENVKEFREDFIAPAFEKEFKKLKK